MSNFIEHISHSQCGSSDGLAVYGTDEGNFNGYCWKCGEYVTDPYGEGGADAGSADHTRRKVNNKTPEEIEKELAEIASCPVVDLPTRNLMAGSLDHYGVTVGLSQFDGKTPMFRHFPYYKKGELSGYKVKVMEERKMWSVGDMREVEPFGWRQALSSGARTLFITEGEEDTIALYQALRAKQHGTKWDHLVPAVISLPSGSGSARSTATRFLGDFTANFKEIVLVFDQDDAGEEATRQFTGVIPTARAVTIPGKDANACVVSGQSLALANAVLFKAALVKNTRIVWGPDLYEAGKTKPEPGLSWPWQGITKMTRGIRFGETYYLGAGVKMGKSEIVNTLAAHLIVEHGLKVFLAKPEEANAKTIKMLLGKVAGSFFHDPEREFDEAAYDKAAEAVLPNVALLNLYQHLGWNSLRSDILSAVSAGCKAVFIDPITNLTNGVGSGEANTQLQEIAQELAAMALDLDIVIFIFCHLKAPEAGSAHERGGKVLSHQFAGSRAMMRSCNLMLGLEGDKDPDKPMEDRNMRKLVVLEDREFGSSGYVWLYWDNNTGLFNEVKS